MAVKREKVVQTAEKYVQRGKIDAAIREYRKVLAEQPDDAATLNRVGDLYARSERIDEAIRLFTQIAQNYTADGFFPKATAIYKKIIKLDPTRLGVYEQLAGLYHRQGLLNEARTQYQVLADYYLKHDNATSATAIYERMTAVDPDDPSVRVRLAELYQRQKLLDKAMAQYRRIAEMMLDHGHAEEAEQVLLKALAVDASDLGFVTDGVAKLKEAGRVGAAARFLAAAVQRNPEAARVADVVDVPAAAEERAEPAPAEEEAAAEEAEEADTTPGLAAAAGEPAAAPAEPELAAGDADLVLDLEEEPEAPTFEAAEPDETGAEEPPAEPAASTFGDLGRFPGDETTSTGEITLDLDLDLLELEEGPPASQVQPPPDMVAEPAAAEPPPEPAAPPPAAPPPAAPPPAPAEEIDADFLERTAAELHPERIRQEEDLVTEAEVLAKYGLTDKAMERLGELLVLNPQHPGGLGLLVRLHVDEERHDGAAELATELLQTAPRSEAWAQTWERLEHAGFQRTEQGVVLPPGAGEEEADTTPGLAVVAEEPAEQVEEPEPEPVLDLAPAVGEEEIEAPAGEEPQAEEREAPAEEVLFDARELGDLEATDVPATDVPATDVPTSDALPADAPAAAAPPPSDRAAAEAPPPEPAAAAPSEPAAPPPAAPPRRARTDVESLLASLTADMLPSRRRRPAAPPARQPATAETPAPPAAARPAAEAAPPAPPPAAEPRSAEPSPDWLERTTSGPAPPAAEVGMFSDEDDFFDLAAELEEELSREGALDGDDLLLHQPHEQSLEEIVEGFKKGVAENLSEEDHHTHFDLGIAYREMGLLDEAVGEFQVAAKSPELLVECCSMLGLCFLDKGLPELAVKWYRRGLAAPGLSEEDQLGLLYDLGNAQMIAGERGEAHHTFLDIYGTNSNYRDVVAKVEETRRR